MQPHAIRAPILLLPMLLLPGGCATGVVPPVGPSDPVTIAVTDYGRHSSLVVPDEDGAGSVEYAFGDWNWFAAGHNSLKDAVNALFSSDDSTLGRRYYAVATDAPKLEQALGADYVMVVQVSRQRMESLRARLDQRYESRADREVFNANMGLWFVPVDAPYGLFHNCNHVTAEWLRELGCEIRGSAFWSRFKPAKG